MVHVLAQVAMEDVAKFVSVFATKGAEMRRLHGSLGSQVFRVADDPGRLVILFAWENREAFEDFVSDPEVKPVMKSSGTTALPHFTILEEFAEFPV